MLSLNKSNLSTKIYTIVGYNDNPKAGTDIGIEVELEGKLFGDNNRSSMWSVKGEGSLRNGGMEYVLRKPISIDMLPKALDEFAGYMEKSVPHASIRCSTHIHVSVLDFTVAQTWNAMLAWYFVENLLVQTQSPNRQGNLFALRLSDAEEIAVSIQEAMAGSDSFHTFHPERNRYAALNLCAITKFGSFEFRFLDAMTKTTDLDRWCRLLHRFVNTAKSVGPAELLEMYEKKTANNFLSYFFGSEFVPFITKGLTPGEVTRLLHTNYDHIFEFSKLLQSARFSLPPRLWNDDLIEEPDAKMYKAPVEGGWISDWGAVPTTPPPFPGTVHAPMQPMAQPIAQPTSTLADYGLSEDADSWTPGQWALYHTLFDQGLINAATGVTTHTESPDDDDEDNL